MTDPEIIKAFDRLEKEMKESLDNMEEACQSLKALETDKRKYIYDWIKEQNK